MKSTTQTVIGIRNVGEAADNGTIHAGTLKECLMFLIERVGEISMASRIQICLARNKADCELGLGTARSNRIDADMKDTLASLLNGLDQDDLAGDPAKIGKGEPGFNDPEDDWIQP